MNPNATARKASRVALRLAKARSYREAWEKYKQYPQWDNEKSFYQWLLLHEEYDEELQVDPAASQPSATDVYSMFVDVPLEKYAAAGSPRAGERIYSSESRQFARVRDVKINRGTVRVALTIIA